MIRWLGADAQSAAEVSRAKNPSRYGVNAAAGRGNNTDIANRIVAVRVIEKVEEVRTKFEARRLTNRPALQHGEIHTALSGSSQRVTANFSEVGSYIPRQRIRIVSAGDWLPGLHDRHRECVRIEVVPWRGVAHRCS